MVEVRVREDGSVDMDGQPLFLTNPERLAQSVLKLSPMEQARFISELADEMAIARPNWEAPFVHQLEAITSAPNFTRDGLSLFRAIARHCEEMYKDTSRADLASDEAGRLNMYLIEEDLAGLVLMLAYVHIQDNDELGSLARWLIEDLEELKGVPYQALRADLEGKLELMYEKDVEVREITARWAAQEGR